MFAFPELYRDRPEWTIWLQAVSSAGESEVAATACDAKGSRAKTETTASAAAGE